MKAIHVLLLISIYLKYVTNFKKLRSNLCSESEIVFHGELIKEIVTLIMLQNRWVHGNIILNSIIYI